jgi:hypothetical protein
MARHFDDEPKERVFKTVKYVAAHGHLLSTVSYVSFEIGLFVREHSVHHADAGFRVVRCSGERITVHIRRAVWVQVTHVSFTWQGVKNDHFSTT